MDREKQILICRMCRLCGWVGGLTCFIGVIAAVLVYFDDAGKWPGQASGEGMQQESNDLAVWEAPTVSPIVLEDEEELVQYGYELIAHTAVYLGPKGKVYQISNGMNCQNCHSGAGTVPFGNNFGKVAVTYPKLRNRSGTVENLKKRVNDCIERSLNGQKLDTNSREMEAMVAYMKWVGKDVPHEEAFEGFGLIPLTPLDEPADPVKGKAVFMNHCARCHGEDGGGQLAASGLEWLYPPLFGKNSYNTAAGLYRLSTFASYIKHNMPYGVTYDNPLLTDEEAWNVAAYVNSMPRPKRHFPNDWPDISKKPIDHPFGPYEDSFPESQHKYGPFDPIESAYLDRSGKAVAGKTKQLLKTIETDKAIIP